MESSSTFNGEPSQKSRGGRFPNRSRSSKRSANLLMFLVCSPSASPIEFVHEAALPEFIDKAKLDEVLHFGFGRSCIRERLDL